MVVEVGDNRAAPKRSTRAYLSPCPTRHPRLGINTPNMHKPDAWRADANVQQHPDAWRCQSELGRRSQLVVRWVLGNQVLAILNAQL